MSLPPHILSVGKNRNLMSSRSMILRGAGFAVDEAYSVETAIQLVDQDSIDVTLVCDTISCSEQNVLISTIRAMRQLMPILCIHSFAIEAAPRTCIAIGNDPEALLNALWKAIYRQENSIT